MLNFKDTDTMKRILKLLFPVILLTAMFSCKPSAYDTFGSIYGVVTDMDTAEPIVNAIVVLSPGGTSLMTAENGRYEYQALEPQQYTITVQKNGYSTNRKSVTVVPGEKTEANLRLQKTARPNYNVQTLPVITIIGNRVVFMGKCSRYGYSDPQEVGFIYTQDGQSIETGVRVAVPLPEPQNDIFNFESGTYKVYAYTKDSYGEDIGTPQTFKIEQAPQGIIVWRQQGLMIQETDIPVGNCEWLEASSACQSSRVGGYSDWRMPTRGELSTICSYKDIIGGFSSDSYWSSTFYKTEDGHDWYYVVRMNDYCDDDFISWTSRKVRAVRTITE